MTATENANSAITASYENKWLFSCSSLTTINGLCTKSNGWGQDEGIVLVFTSLKTYTEDKRCHPGLPLAQGRIGILKIFI